MIHFEPSVDCRTPDCGVRSVSPCLVIERSAVGRGILVGIRFQVGVIFRVGINDCPEYAACVLDRRVTRQALDVEDVRVDEQMHHRLEIIRIGASDIGRDEHAVALATKRTAMQRG